MIAYHYCSAETLLNILKTNEIWMSDLRHVNDPSEVTGSPSIITEEFTKTFPVETHRPSIEYAAEDGCFFSLSLSKNGDLLSQWRAYSSNGTGFCIGIDLEMLKYCNLVLATGETIVFRGLEGTCFFSYSDVFYNKDSYRMHISKILNEYKNEHGIPFESKNGNVDISGFILFHRLILEACLLKDSFYEEEVEVRCSAYINTEIYQMTKHLEQQMQGKSIKFRHVNGRLLPYVPLSLSNNIAQINSLVSIRIGPNNLMSIKELNLLLAESGYKGVQALKSDGQLR